VGSARLHTWGINSKYMEDKHDDMSFTASASRSIRATSAMSQMSQDEPYCCAYEGGNTIVLNTRHDVHSCLKDIEEMLEPA
jgi:hypothetical protein